MGSMHVSSPVASTNAAAAANKDKEKDKTTADCEHVSSTVTQFAGTAVREESTAAVVTETEKSAPAPAVAEAQAEVAVAQARLDLAEARLDRAELSEETVVAKQDGAPAPKEVVAVTEKATGDVEESEAHLSSVEDKTGLTATTTAEAPPPQTKDEADQRVAAAEAELAKAMDQQAQLKTGTTPVDEAEWNAALSDSSDQVTNPPPPPALSASTQAVVAAGKQVDDFGDQNKLDAQELSAETQKLVTELGKVDDLVADNKIDKQQLGQSTNDLVSVLTQVDQYIADVLAGQMPTALQPAPSAPAPSAPAATAPATTAPTTTAPPQATTMPVQVDSTQMRLLEVLNQLMALLSNPSAGTKPQLPPTSSPTELGNVINRLERATDRFERAENEAGTLGAYMRDKGIKTLDVNQLYNLSNNKGGKVPEDVQQAAKFMLQNPDIYKKIETSDVAGADGISGVANFDKAAQGLTKFDQPIGIARPTVAPMPQPNLAERAKDEAGALAAYMNANGMKKLDVNQLYNLSNNKGGNVPPDVQQAAKFMLQHPAIYKKIETADVKGADGISGVGNMNKAAQGLINLDQPTLQPIRPAVMPRPGLGERAENEAGTLAAYMNAKGLKTIDVNQLYNLSNNKGGDVPKDVQQAAKFMLQHPAIFKKIETADVKGADGISGVGNLNKAAQGLLNLDRPTLQPIRAAVMPRADLGERAENEAGTLAAYMNDKGLKTIDVNQLYNLSNNKGGNVPEDVQQAAKFMLQHPAIFKKIETADVKGADGISGVGNLNKAAQGQINLDASVSLRPAVMPRQSLGERAENEAGTLAAYMNANGLKVIDVNQLYNLSNNKGGNVPPDVQQAAKFMLQNPEIYKKIETSDVAGADGISGVANLNKAAQGLTDFGSTPIHAPIATIQAGQSAEVMAIMQQLQASMVQRTQSAQDALQSLMSIGGMSAGAAIGNAPDAMPFGVQGDEDESPDAR
ncbi:hypothetical protein ACPOLB_24960 [Rubrivivax sp. RP6-9]|uniref:hypothetical protein n=1 Tax=Rubrivivax sp. RP6-9 TaxID=3415750 RepID=UPI003CC5B3F1